MKAFFKVGLVFNGNEKNQMYKFTTSGLNNDASSYIRLHNPTDNVASVEFIFRDRFWAHIFDLKIFQPE